MTKDLTEKLPLFRAFFNLKKIIFRKDPWQRPHWRETTPTFRSDFPVYIYIKNAADKGRHWRESTPLLVSTFPVYTTAKEWFQSDFHVNESQVHPSSETISLIFKVVFEEGFRYCYGHFYIALFSAGESLTAFVSHLILNEWPDVSFDIMFFNIYQTGVLTALFDY